MDLSNFCAACEMLDREDVEVWEARFDGHSFGSWYITVRRGNELRRSVWDNRDGWLRHQSSRTSGVWDDVSDARGVEAQTVEHVVNFLKG